MTGSSSTRVAGPRPASDAEASLADRLLVGAGFAGALLLMTACTTQPKLAANDLSREREALIQADREFSRMSVEKGAVAAFAHFFAEDAVALPASAPPVHGRDAIVKALSAGPPESLIWQPLASAVSEAGDLGYTFGTYESREQGTDGKPKITTGKYTSIWRRQKDGTWKIVLDIGNQAPVAPAH